MARSKFYNWRARYEKANEHDSWIPRAHWIEGRERNKIVNFARQFSLEGYRRLTFMMLDCDIVAVGPSTTFARYSTVAPALSSTTNCESP